MENKNIAQKNSPELKSAISFHTLIFIIKNTIILILINPSSLSELGSIKTIVYVKISIVYIINIHILAGFLWSLLNIDIVLYSNISYTAFLLYQMAVVNCLQILGVYIRQKMEFSYFLVVLIAVVSLLEFIFIKDFIKILHPISMRKIKTFTNDCDIIDAFHKRSALHSLKFGMLSFVFAFLCYDTILLISGTETTESSIENEFINQFCGFERIIQTITAILTLFIIFLSTINIDNESVFQRKLILFLIVCVLGLDLCSFFDHVGTFSLLLTNFFHTWRMIFFVYSFYVIYQDMQTCGINLVTVTKNRILTSKKL